MSTGPVRGAQPEILPAGIYTAAEVAKALHHSVRWFRANRRALARDGFPPPVSRVGRPRWLGAALIAWMRSSSEASAQQTTPPGNVVSLAARARAVARRRA